MNRIFGYMKSTDVPTQEDAPSRSLPASWYRSDAMYQLERRAIFSRNWIVVSHQLRLADPGQYIQLQEAGFSFFLVKDRQGNINGFHNVCRHRAYPVVQEKEGKVNILVCKYHGMPSFLHGKSFEWPQF
jgi:phenylpropionate dioxygenase-like ring-hydroxylating dioxygenase large terminal subunit